jgi:hypothetical protein
MRLDLRDAGRQHGWIHCVGDCVRVGEHHWIESGDWSIDDHMVIGARCWSCVRWCIELCAVPSMLQSDHNLMSRGARMNVESDSMSPAKSPALKCPALRAVEACARAA